MSAFEDVPLIDHHCHGLVPKDLSDADFAAGISEAYAPPPRGTSHWDKPTGLAVRAHCAPLLGLDPFCSPKAYTERRRKLGAKKVNEIFLRAARLEALLVDTGNKPERLVDVARMAKLAGVPAYEVVRMESVAERVAAAGVSVAGFANAFEEALESAAKTAVGLKSIMAYRATLAVETRAPDAHEVAEAAGRWLKAIEETGRVRITDPVLEAHLVWTGAGLARERGLPLQFHIGVGDPDITLHAVDPSHLTAFFRTSESWGVNFTLLHCYPFHREAGVLAENFPHVYFDVGFILNWVGPSYARILGEALEFAPFTKQLYSSDAFALAELYYLGALRFRTALRRHLDAWIREGECTARDAERIVEFIARGNARRIYPLPKAAAKTRQKK